MSEDNGQTGIRKTLPLVPYGLGQPGMVYLNRKIR